MKQTPDKKLADSFAPLIKKLEYVNYNTQTFGEIIEKTYQLATPNIKATYQNSQSQTLEFVSAGDELVETFSEMNGNKNFFEKWRDPDGNFCMEWIIYCSNSRINSSNQY